MKLTPTAIPDVIVCEPTVHGDHRGFFMETWRESSFADIAPGLRFVQDNHSKSGKGILRGLHRHGGAFAEGAEEHQRPPACRGQLAQEPARGEVPALLRAVCRQRPGDHPQVVAGKETRPSREYPLQLASAAPEGLSQLAIEPVS